VLLVVYPDIDSSGAHGEGRFNLLKARSSAPSAHGATTMPPPSHSSMAWVKAEIPCQARRPDDGHHDSGRAGDHECYLFSSVGSPP
jgi:hypothetical protein